MRKPQQTTGYLQGQMLLAMPGMGDQRFARTVIYLCAHSEAGAMGIVVNKPLDTITFHELLDQLNIDRTKADPDLRVHFGGPVSPAQGFVLHSTDFMREGSLKVGDEIGLTNTVDVLRAMALGQGPKRALLALGYAGWSAGQLDAEIQANGWLHAPADFDLIFDGAPTEKWVRAVGTLGIDLAALSGAAGHA